MEQCILYDTQETFCFLFICFFRPLAMHVLYVFTIYEWLFRVVTEAVLSDHCYSYTTATFTFPSLHLNELPTSL